MMDSTTTTMLAIGVLVIVFGAVCAYLFYRVEYMEKKLSMMESMIMDTRLAIDSLLSEDGSAGGAEPAPIASVIPEGVLSPPMPIDTADTEQIPDATFYNSVLQQVHEEQPAAAEVPAVSGGEESLEAVLKGFETQESADVSGAGVVRAEPGGMTLESIGASGPNYEAMTRSELLTLADKRGARVKRSANRNEIISVLRKTESSTNRDGETGSENVSGSATGGALAAIFPAGASLDGGDAELVADESLSS